MLDSRDYRQIEGNVLHEAHKVIIKSHAHLTVLALRLVCGSWGSTTCPMSSSQDAATRSPMLDHLIDKVELTLHFDVPAKGNAVNIEAKIDDPTIAEGDGDDNA
ncbi:hypothetical protein Ancab_039132 [Ancistrocladus abbreviatus]